MHCIVLPVKFDGVLPVKFDGVLFISVLRNKQLFKKIGRQKFTTGVQRPTIFYYFKRRSFQTLVSVGQGLAYQFLSDFPRRL
jgi:hypothetical protein